MDARYINPFVKSVCNTFGTMCGLPVTIGKPSLKQGDQPYSDVSSVIGFSGDATGSVVLNFGFETASKIASSFAGIDITPEHPDFADALGELANMVAGGAKAQFEGLNISISLPNVIVGPKHNVSASKNTPRLIIPVSDGRGRIHGRGRNGHGQDADRNCRTPSRRSPSVKILLVDDSRTIRNIQKNVLKQLGHTDVEEAEDGVQALAKFKENTPDLVFVDWNMPNMDGITLVRKIREINTTVPLIMCTTEAEKSRVLEALKAGVNNYVVKPFTVESLGEKIQQTISKTGAPA